MSGIKFLICKIFLSIFIVFFLPACYPIEQSDIELTATEGVEAATKPADSHASQETEFSSDGENLPIPAETQFVQPSPNLIIWHGFDKVFSLTLLELIEGFQRERPDIFLQVVYVPHEDLFERYIKAVNDGRGPSVLFGDGEWGSRLFDLNAIADVAQELTPDLPMEINPAALGAVVYGDAVIGFPHSMRGIVMFRNSAIMPEAPETYEELINYSRDVTKGRILGAYLERGDLFAYPQLTACSGNLLDSSGNPAFNNSAGLCWFDLLRSFEVIGPVSFNSNDDRDRFLDGKVGVIFEGTWNIQSFTDALGDDLVIDPWPGLYGSHLSGYVWTDNMYINANLSDADREAAMDFVQYILSPESQAVLARLGKIPATLYRDVKERIIFQAVAALIHGTPYPMIPEMQVYLKPMHEALVAVFMSGQEPTIALEQAEDQIIERIVDFSVREDDN